MVFDKKWAKITPDMDKDIAIEMENIRLKLKEVEKDENRPKYHLASPAGTLIDTWGATYYRGEYHVFYDINVPTDGGKCKQCFGHISSENLIEWKHLPIALTPDLNADELRLNDGCIEFDGRGNPIMWYTRVFTDDRPREHIPVSGDENLVTWKRICDADAITMENHGGPEFYGGWSDPIIFEEAGRTFMIISKCITVEGNRDVIPIYEATDDSLLSWEYRGFFLDETGEVLNFIKIDEKWVLIHSPYNNPVWRVGQFDLKTCKFIPEQKGILSYGYITQGDLETSSRGFYATTVTKEPDNVIFGWISGFDSPVPEKWMGAIGIPRRVALDEQMRVTMSPVCELEGLRQEKFDIDPSGGRVKSKNTIEIKLELSDFDEDDELYINIGGTEISLSGSEYKLRDITVDATQYGIPFNVHLYIDVCIAELFINDGICSISRCISALDEEVSVSVSTKKGKASIKDGSIWNLKSMG